MSQLDSDDLGPDVVYVNGVAGIICSYVVIDATGRLIHDAGAEYMAERLARTSPGCKVQAIVSTNGHESFIDLTQIHTKCLCGGLMPRDRIMCEDCIKEMQL